MAQTIKLDALSLESVPVAWETKEFDGSDHDPTSDATYIAIVAFGTKPGVSDWHQGTWFPTKVNGRWISLLQIGPTAASGVLLVAGLRYAVYAKLVDNPDAPVKPVGVLVAE